jgi:molybdopterin molybdotransferase
MVFVKKEILNLMPLAEAQRLALAHIKPISEREPLKTWEAPGRILAQDVYSPADLPGFARSGMDGYAVRATDTRGASPERPVRLALIGRVRMGDDPVAMPNVKAGETVEIPTGGALPPGADAVVIIEETALAGPRLIEVFSQVYPGADVIAPDDDLRAGEWVLHAGGLLRAQDLGTLLALGITEIEVTRRVRVGILSTGDELVAPEQEPRPGQVRDINSYTLRAQMLEMGADPKLHGIVPDDERRLRKTLERALGENDLLLISGGSSVGARDATAKISSELGQVLIHGLRIRPGKPTIFAMARGIPVIGLPGNPVSSMVVTEVFVGPLVRALSGARDCRRRRPLVRARLAEAIASERGRTDFVRVRLAQQGDQQMAQPIYGHTTNIAGLSRADGLLQIPAESSGLDAGADVWVERW